MSPTSSSATSREVQTCESEIQSQMLYVSQANLNTRGWIRGRSTLSNFCRVAFISLCRCLLPTGVETRTPSQRVKAPPTVASSLTHQLCISRDLSLGPPVERLESRYPFSVVCLGSGILPQKRVKRALTGGPRIICPATPRTSKLR